MGFFSFLFGDKEIDAFRKWMQSASYDELMDEYEKRRQEWMANGYGGNGEKTIAMKMLDAEMSRRTAEEWEKDPHRHPGYHWSDANRWEK